MRNKSLKFLLPDATLRNRDVGLRNRFVVVVVVVLVDGKLVVAVGVDDVASEVEGEDVWAALGLKAFCFVDGFFIITLGQLGVRMEE